MLVDMTARIRDGTDDAISIRQRLDLSETSDFMLELLENARPWKSRIVEEFTFDGSAHVRVESSYQLDFPPELVEHHGGRGYESANVLLPLTSREKRPLLNLSITGPAGRSAQLLPRASIAALETEFLMRLIRTSPARERIAAGLPEALMEAICVFTPDYFDNVLDEAAGDIELATHRYLNSGMAGHLRIGSGAVRKWRSRTEEAGQLLAPYGSELPPARSSSEDILLAIPRVDPVPQSLEEIDALVDGYCEALRTAAQVDDALLLAALAEYGRRYVFVVEVEVPLWEPSTIKVSEDRPLGARERFGLPLGGWVSQTFGLGDARSAHLEARATDPNVMIDDFKVCDLSGGRIGLGPVESARRTDETLALYSSEAERPQYTRIDLRLRPRRHLRWTSRGLLILNLTALLAALTLPHDEMLVERLGIITVPTTVAATFVLIRDQSALASRLQATARIWIALTTAMLWLVVLVLLMTFRPPQRQSSIEIHIGASRSGQALGRPVTSPGRGPKMASNAQRGNGRIGAVRGRTQVRNPKTGMWTKRDTSTGRFMDVKQSGGTFKGVRRER